MDALLILHQLLNWYGGVQVKATQGHDQLVFFGRFFPFSIPHIILSSCKQRRLCSLFLPSPSLPSLFSLSNLLSLPSPPFSFSLCCGVTACRCCMQGVQLVLCGPSVWSPLSPEAANRVDERESKTIYFNLFRMPELCPEFLQSLIPQSQQLQIPYSCGAVSALQLVSPNSHFTQLCLFKSLSAQKC